MEYTFTLKYRVADEQTCPGALVERLGAAGCDDALVGIGLPGRLALEFSRDAGSAEEAVRSALVDVKRAIPEAKLIEGSPDLVGLTDVAEIVGVSRQAMRKLMLNNRTTFPTPVHEGHSAIWHLAEVLDWLETKGGYQFDRNVQEAAAVMFQVNLAKEANRPWGDSTVQKLSARWANLG